MTKVKLYPHEEICPEGIELEISPGEYLCEKLLDKGIPVEHACELSCACTTCHVVVRKGFDSLAEASDSEEDMLDMAYEPKKNSRLSCQLTVSEELEGLVVKLPEKQA